MHDIRDKKGTRYQKLSMLDEVARLKNRLWKMNSGNNNDWAKGKKLNLEKTSRIRGKEPKDGHNETALQ